MRIDVVSIFPEYLAPLDLSLIGKVLDYFWHLAMPLACLLIAYGVGAVNPLSFAGRAPVT